MTERPLATTATPPAVAVPEAPGHASRASATPAPGSDGGALKWLARRPYVLLVLTMMFWSGNYVSARAVAGELGPAVLALGRWGLAFLLLVPFTWRHVVRDAPVLRENLGIVVLLGVLGIGAYNTFIYIGVAMTTVVNATLLASLFPVTVALCGFILYRDRLTLPQAAGIAVATAGALVVLTEGHLAALGGLTINRGDLFIILSQLLWAIYTVLLRRRPPLHPLTLLTATIAVGLMTLIPYTAFEILVRGEPVTVSAKTVLIVAYVALFPSLAAFLAFNRAVELIGSNRTGPFFHLIPVFGAILAVILLGERVHPYHLVGWVLIVSGIVCAQLGRKPAP